MSETELRDALANLRVDLAEVKGDVKAILKQNVDGEKVHDDHEQRLRRLERWMFSLTAVAATLGSSAGVVVSRLLGG